MRACTSPNCSAFRTRRPAAPALGPEAEQLLLPQREEREGGDQQQDEHERHEPLEGGARRLVGGAGDRVAQPAERRPPPEAQGWHLEQDDGGQQHAAEHEGDGPEVAPPDAAHDVAHSPAQDGRAGHEAGRRHQAVAHERQDAGGEDGGQHDGRTSRIGVWGMPSSRYSAPAISNPKPSYQAVRWLWASSTAVAGAVRARASVTRAAARPSTSPRRCGDDPADADRPVGLGQDAQVGDWAHRRRRRSRGARSPARGRARPVRGRRTPAPPRTRRPGAASSRYRVRASRSAKAAARIGRTASRSCRSPARWPVRPPWSWSMAVPPATPSARFDRAPRA